MNKKAEPLIALDEIEPMVALWTKAEAALIAERDEARAQAAALAEAGSHKRKCSIWSGVTGCTCGWDDALAAYDKAKVPQ